MDIRSQPGIARSLLGRGVNALIIEGNEAGGHIGPVPTAVLAEQILPHTTEVPVFVAGTRGGLRLAAIEGDVDRGSLMAGQSIGLAVDEAEKILVRLGR